MEKKLTAVVENHFDQIWRRCFHRDIVHRGECFISYEKIQQYYIDKNLEMARKNEEHRFQIESPSVVENYLRRFPEREAEIRALYAKGVLKTTNTGYAIIDSNMISPEAIVRNYLISDAFFAKFMGQTPQIANRSDAFGNSAQLPQILKAFGAKYVTEIYYNPFDDDVWVGLDKSAICISHHVYLGGGGGWFKYRPCRSCKGFGRLNGAKCPSCNGLGIDRKTAEKKRSPIKISSKSNDSGVMRIGGEELIPSEDIWKDIAALRADGKNVTLGHWDELLERYRAQIKQVESGDLAGLKVRESPEFNPNTTGGYVTRIRTKQRLCDAENKLLAGETLAAMALINRNDYQSFDREWRDLLICAFHDVAYGTVVDAGYEEIMDMYDEIDKACRCRFLSEGGGDVLYLFNPTSKPYSGLYRMADGHEAVVRELAPYAIQRVKLLPPPQTLYMAQKSDNTLQEVIFTGKEAGSTIADGGEGFAAENEYLRLDADQNGICRITDKRFGTVVDMVAGARPFEWILQSDNGSPWATLEPPHMTYPLAERTALQAVQKGNGRTRICYKTKIPMRESNAVSETYIDWSVTLIDGCDRLRLDATVENWCSFNRRLMVRTPLTVKNGKDIYGIPGGMLERAPYEPSYEWNGANGDWPAFRFGGVESDTVSVAIFNQGTPAYQIKEEDGIKHLYISVLRSPTFPTCLHEPASYTMTAYDGMRDEGSHSFAFELVAYGTRFAQSDVVTDAEQFSRPPLPVAGDLQVVPMPTVLEGTASITHVKPAEDGCGVILRVTEHGGVAGTVTVSLPDWVTAVFRTDLPEKRKEQLPLEKKVSLPLRPFEIATLRLMVR